MGLQLAFAECMDCFDRCAFRLGKWLQCKSCCQHYALSRGYQAKELSMQIGGLLMLRQLCINGAQCWSICWAPCLEVDGYPAGFKQSAVQELAIIENGLLSPSFMIL